MDEQGLSVAADTTPAPSTQARTKKKKGRLGAAEQTLVQTAIDTLNAVRPQTEDSCPFGSMVSKELSTMDDFNRRIAKKIINEVLFVRNCGALTMSDKFQHTLLS